MDTERPIVAPLVSVVAILILACAACAAAPAIEKPKADAPVTVTENANFFTLDNGIVKAAINKRTSRSQRRSQS